MSQFFQTSSQQYLDTSVDLNTTRDELDENGENLDKYEETSNLNQTKIVQSKVISSLIFAKLLYFNWWYLWLWLVFEISPLLFHFYISADPGKETENIIRIALVAMSFFAKLLCLSLGKKANIQGDVK